MSYLNQRQHSAEPANDKNGSHSQSGDSISVAVTLFKSKVHTAGEQRIFALHDLIDMHADPKIHIDKENLPLIKYSVLPSNSRAAGVLPINITAIVGDYDAGAVSIATAADRLSAVGIGAFFYTTRRHQLTKPRWRVVAPLANAISPYRLAEYVDAINGALGGILASESWEITRCYFYGSVQSIAYEFATSHGVPLDHRMDKGINWEPIPKPYRESQAKQRNNHTKAGKEDRYFDRATAIHQANDQTIHDLEIALEVIWDRADQRATWNETFLAMMSLKGTPYTDQARALIEKWSQTHSEKWCATEDDSTKWDRDVSTELTYKSIFHWADETDIQNGVYGTPLGWRAVAAGASEKSRRNANFDANVFSFADFTAALNAPNYIWHHVLQAGCLYALTARWGHGKTALMITVALHVATGEPLAGHATKSKRVLFMCGENPEDVRLRALAAALRFGISPDLLATQIYFTQRPFSVDEPEALRRFVQEAVTFGPFGLLVIDTGPAHSSAEDEDDNRGMHKLAMAMRTLMEPLGNPATVVLMHPTKSATRDDLQPRGGGAFSGSIDGELCAWQSDGKIEFFHRTKFRGPGFKSIWFDLEKYIFPSMVDNFGAEVLTVLAVQTNTSGKGGEGGNTTRVTRHALTALLALLADELVCCVNPPWAMDAAKSLGCSPPQKVVEEKNWRAQFIAGRGAANTPSAATKAFQRAKKKLEESGQVIIWNGMCWVA